MALTLLRRWAQMASVPMFSDLALPFLLLLCLSYPVCPPLCPSNAAFIPGFLTSSTHAINVLPSMEPSPHLSRWRLWLPKAVCWAVLDPVLFFTHRNDLSYALENPPSYLLTTPHCVIQYPVPLQDRLYMHHSADLELIGL